MTAEERELALQEAEDRPVLELLKAREAARKKKVEELKQRLQKEQEAETLLLRPQYMVQCCNPHEPPLHGTLLYICLMVPRLPPVVALLYLIAKHDRAVCCQYTYD